MSTLWFEMCLLRAGTTIKIREVKLVSINSHECLFYMLTLTHTLSQQ